MVKKELPDGRAFQILFSESEVVVLEVLFSVLGGVELLFQDA